MPAPRSGRVRDFSHRQDAEPVYGFPRQTSLWSPSRLPVLERLFWSLGASEPRVPPVSDGIHGYHTQSRLGGARQAS